MALALVSMVDRSATPSTAIYTAKMVASMIAVTAPTIARTPGRPRWRDITLASASRESAMRSVPRN